MHSDETVRVVVGKVSVELPASLAKRPDTPIDSASAVYEGAGLIVNIDQGPFASRLDRHAGQPDYREAIETVGDTVRDTAGDTPRGIVRRMIFFRSPTRDTYTVATHVSAPTSVTVVVQANASVPERVANAIVESVRIHPLTPNADANP
jgi:hypothetical protein